MNPITEKQAFEGLEVFANQHTGKTCWLDVIDNNMGFYVAFDNTTFESIKSNTFQITDLSLIQIERFRKAYPDFDCYRCLVDFIRPERVLFVRHGAYDLDHPKDMIYGIGEYYTLEGKILRDVA